MEKQNNYIKKDTSENWSKAKNFIPKDKEIIIYTDMLDGMKMGDGKTPVNELPFLHYNEYSIEDDTLVVNTREEVN